MRKQNFDIMGQLIITKVPEKKKKNLNKICLSILPIFNYLTP